MKKKSLSAKKKIHKSLLRYLNNKKIKVIYRRFEDYLLNNKKVKTKIGIAVSGGPDSLALAFLSKCFLLKNNLDGKFFLIDHKLRKDSSKEAKSVINVLKKFNIKCMVLKWHGAKPKSNIQGVARNYRYNLLKNACKKNKINFLLTGHHIDDLYENFFIRLFRGSGLRGLSSFGEKAEYNNDDVVILRPLIKLEKKDLIYTTKRVFHYFVDDPTNTNINFQRTRVRNLILNLYKEGFDKKKFGLTIENLKSANSTINFYVKKNIHENSKFLREKNAHLLNKFFFLQPQEIIFRSISLILNKVSNKYYSPRGKSIIDLIFKIKSNKDKKFTLGGCNIVKVNETVLITKENINKS